MKAWLLLTCGLLWLGGVVFLLRFFAAGKLSGYGIEFGRGVGGTLTLAMALGLLVFVLFGWLWPTITGLRLLLWRNLR